MIAFDVLAGWKLKVMCAAIFLGTLGLGVGTLWLTKNAVEKDRGAIIRSFETACSYVAVPYRLDVAGKPLARKAWGRDCLAEILKLATERAGAATAALATVTTHDAEQDVKATVDRPARQRSTERLIKAEQTLETAHAAVQNGQYGREWIDGLSDAFGLRDAQGIGSPASGSGDAAGTPVAGTAGVPDAPSTPPG